MAPEGSPLACSPVSWRGWHKQQRIQVFVGGSGGRSHGINQSTTGWQEWGHWDRRWGNGCNFLRTEGRGQLPSTERGVASAPLFCLMGDMREDGNTPGAHSIHPHTPFREGVAQRMCAGAEHIIQQSFLTLCPFWGPTPRTLEVSAPPQPLAQALHKHECWMQRGRKELAAGCSRAGCPGSQQGHCSLTDRP